MSEDFLNHHGLETKRKVEEFKNKRMFKNAAPSFDTGTDNVPATKNKESQEDSGTYNNIFAPTNLEEQAGSGAKE